MEMSVLVGLAQCTVEMFRVQTRKRVCSEGFDLPRDWCWTYWLTNCYRNAYAWLSHNCCRKTKRLYTEQCFTSMAIFAHGFSGIPGSNGIPGMPGIPGAPGPQGQQGKDGAKGEPGVKGPRGMTGTRGQKGNPGSLGKNGAPGMMGIKGDKGDEGSHGSSGPPGIKGVKGEQGSKGEKGEIVNSAVSQTNWKQCVWKNLNDDRDSGKIKVQKYLENAMKNKLRVRANLS